MGSGFFDVEKNPRIDAVKDEHMHQHTRELVVAILSARQVS